MAVISQKRQFVFHFVDILKRDFPSEITAYPDLKFGQCIFYPEST